MVVIIACSINGCTNLHTEYFFFYGNWRYNLEIALLINVDLYEYLSDDAKGKLKFTTYDLISNIVHDGSPKSGEGSYRIQLLHKNVRTSKFFRSTRRKDRRKNEQEQKAAFLNKYGFCSIKPMGFYGQNFTGRSEFQQARTEKFINECGSETTLWKWAFTCCAFFLALWTGPHLFGPCRSLVDWQTQLCNKLDFSSTLIDCIPGTGKWFELEDLHVKEILPQMITLTESYIQVWELNMTKTREQRFDEPVEDLATASLKTETAERETLKNFSTEDQHPASTKRKVTFGSEDAEELPASQDLDAKPAKKKKAVSFGNDDSH
uniref:USP domain-containing protein n=1 Tax=Romanomermis culicivorax TaxID=13658 RepID=A0A915HVD0_ROMCU